MNQDGVMTRDAVKVHKLSIEHEVKVAGYWPSSFLNIYKPRQSYVQRWNYEQDEVMNEMESRSIIY